MLTFVWFNAEAKRFGRRRKVLPLQGGFITKFARRRGGAEYFLERVRCCFVWIGFTRRREEMRVGADVLAWVMVAAEGEVR